LEAPPKAPVRAAPEPAPPAHPRNGWFLVIGIGLIVGGLIGGSAAFVLVRNARTAQLPAACRQIGCSDLGSGIPPAFTLSDQNGERVSLEGLRGRVVVLGFMDPVCTKICPLVADEFIRADRMLGSDASKVAFVSVNVNQFHESQEAVRAYSRQRGLDGLSNWHFVTGTTHQLKKVWNLYHVAVIPNATGDVVHTSILYFIDQQGRLRLDALPIQSKASIVTWARSITDLVRYLQAH
jgi:cytochrome oxidase Cu insertion factor (SCO1/SenC/PrrC family)